MIRDLKDYFDPYNLIVQKDGDGGDTAQRMGMFHFAKPDSEPNIIHTLSYLMVKGLLRRHPTMWSETNDMSRDQTESLLMGWYATGAARDLLVDYMERVESTGHYQNGDIFTPLTIGMYFRIMHKKDLLGLYLSDACLLITSFVRLSARVFPKRTQSWPGLQWVGPTDDLNYTMMLLLSKNKYPTILSKLARWVYKWSNPQGAFDWYFREETGAPPINELYRKLIKEP